MSTDFDFSFAANEDFYPPFIARTEVQKYFPWLTPKRMANLDCVGEGPNQAIKNGRAVVYPTKAFLAWLDSRSEKLGASPQKAQEESRNRRGRKTKLQEVRERKG